MRLEKNKVLLFGANGQVGKEVIQVFKTSDYKIIALTKDDADITDIKKLESIFLYNKDARYVINASAFTAVDKAEDEKEACFAVNAIGVKNLASFCKKYDIPLLHLSTDYVFDGDSSQPYKETDKPNPVGNYGQSKYFGEKYVAQELKKHILLRVSWVFSKSNHNFVKTIFQLAKERESLNIVNDQIGAPTSAFDIAKTLLNICQGIDESENPDLLWGIYHYQGRPTVSWYDFSQAIIKSAKNKEKPLVHKTLNAISSNDFPTKAKRPLFSVFDIDKINKNFAIGAANWQKALDEVLDEI